MVQNYGLNAAVWVSLIIGYVLLVVLIPSLTHRLIRPFKSSNTNKLIAATDRG